jgi:hypothetical protein
MALEAKKPAPSKKKLKLFLYGDKGVGKTLATAQFPKAYFLDMEKGASNYSDSLDKMGSWILQTTSFDKVAEQVRELMTTRHEFRTLVIDPITIAYQDLQDKWNRLFERHAKSEKEKELKDFGPRYWGKVKSETRRLRRLLTDLDMNVILTAHQKDLYGENMTKLGVTYDSDVKDGYFFDFIFRLEKRGDKRFAITEKKREDIGKQIFPAEFEWTYENFTGFYGKELMEKASVPVPLATTLQVTEIERLLGIVKIDDKEIEKWMEKAEVETWTEMTEEQISKCIAHLKGKLDAIKGDLAGGMK